MSQSHFQLDQAESIKIFFSILIATCLVKGIRVSAQQTTHGPLSYQTTMQAEGVLFNDWAELGLTAVFSSIISTMITLVSGCCKDACMKKCYNKKKLYERVDDLENHVKPLVPKVEGQEKLLAQMEEYNKARFNDFERRLDMLESGKLVSRSSKSEFDEQVLEDAFNSSFTKAMKLDIVSLRRAPEELSHYLKVLDQIYAAISEKVGLQNHQQFDQNQIDHIMKYLIKSFLDCLTQEGVVLRTVRQRRSRWCSEEKLSLSDEVLAVMLAPLPKNFLLMHPSEHMKKFGEIIKQVKSTQDILAQMGQNKSRTISAAEKSKSVKPLDRKAQIKKTQVSPDIKNSSKCHPKTGLANSKRSRNTVKRSRLAASSRMPSQIKRPAKNSAQQKNDRKRLSGKPAP